MKITDVKLLVLERTDAKGITQQNHFLRVTTDEGIESRCHTRMEAGDVERMRPLVIGEDPLHREMLFQRLLVATRRLHGRSGWFGSFDNCLWDIAGKAAGLPVHALIGRVRDRFPAYFTRGRRELEGYLDDISEAREKAGIEGYKFHSYRNGKEDIPILRAVREAVGPDYALMHDPVCCYDYADALMVGRVLEELDFVWFEEPINEQKMDLYQRLCGELVIPVIATETLMHDLWMSAQWLKQGATDRLRGNAYYGTTQVLKLAHFAELYDTNIEINWLGGLYGLIHACLGCCIDNTDFFEAFTPEADGMRVQAEEWGLVNAPLIESGSVAPPDGPGWGAEWDEPRFQSLLTQEL